MATLKSNLDSNIRYFIKNDDAVKPSFSEFFLEKNSLSTCSMVEISAVSTKELAPGNSKVNFRSFRDFVDKKTFTFF